MAKNINSLRTGIFSPYNCNIRLEWLVSFNFFQLEGNIVGNYAVVSTVCGREEEQNFSLFSFIIHSSCNLEWLLVNAFLLHLRCYIEFLISTSLHLYSYNLKTKMISELVRLPSTTYFNMEITTPNKMIDRCCCFLDFPITETINVFTSAII